MEDKLNQVQNDAEVAQDKIMRASGHLDEVRQTLAEIDQMVSGWTERGKGGRERRDGLELGLGVDVAGCLEC